MDNLTVIREYRDGESISSLAKKYNVYTNKIRRILINGDVKIRTPSEAQKLALAKGRSKHPTEGKKRTKEEKNKIGKSVSEAYNNLTNNEKNKRKKRHRDYWNSISKEEKEKCIKRMNKGRIESAFKGSHLERELVNKLTEHGVKVNFHTKVFGDVEVDLFLPEYSLAIEIDGPTHYKPIWGEDALKKTKSADKRKNGYLTSNGVTVLRVKNFKNSFAMNDAIKMSEYILELLNKEREAVVMKVDLVKI